MKSQKLNSFGTDDLKDFILQWNIDFPIDRWWRKTHEVTFNSPVHREMSFIDMTIEFIEDQLYNDSYERRRKRIEDPYIPGRKNFLFERAEILQELSEDEFDSIGLDD